MEHKEFKSPNINQIFLRITQMAKDGNFQDPSYNPVIHAIDLEEFLPLISDRIITTMLTDEPLNDGIIRLLGNEAMIPQLSVGVFRRKIPTGTRITAVVSPCSYDGFEFREEDNNASAINTTGYPHFSFIYTYSKDPRRLTTGLGNLHPAPYLAVYPKEIVNNCSFIVDYENNVHKPGNFNDRAYLEMKLKEQYKNLQKILKGPQGNLN